ncbi:GGDEF domain-containing protein [Thauera humireducens]
MEQTLRDAATRDMLTGLYNRHRGEQLLEEAAANARTDGGQLSVVVCDVDHFKQVNDRFGHPAGDRILVEISRILRQSVRGHDAVIRWGGEEFVIVLDACRQSTAIDLAERIRARVAAYRDSEVGKVTLSLGLATLAPGEMTDALFARADAALYQAKRGGRDRLSIAPQPD